MHKKHHYQLTINWTGNTGEGTKHYRKYDRSHTISAPGKTMIEGSSDPSFMGDATKYNPEELLVASLSACHMLWFLHLCSEAGVIVVAYTDQASGTMVETKNGGGRFTDVTLYPEVVVTEAAMVDKANALHPVANKRCFIANSCNFPVHHQPSCKSAAI